MNPDESAGFVLASRDPAAPAPVRVGTQVQGRLDAVLFELTLRQTYRNTSDRVLEVVYTFPLPVQAVLLGFASELGGVRQEGVVVAAPAAEQRYESALAEGDAPVLLEAHAGGLHTANIGNLAPGDEIVLECRFAQLIAFEQGRLRVSIPTTVAPRFGDAGRAGLQPQQVPEASLEAEHALALTLRIGESLAGAAIECPTHRVEQGRDADGRLCLTLAPGAMLDRDVVVVVTPREPRPSLQVRATDPFAPEAPVVRMAALQLPPAAPRERIAVHLLVDCSGSMAGDSMASARAALQGVVAGLGAQDRVGLSRFGSSVEHLSGPMEAALPGLRHLTICIDRLQADLGGTEMATALDAVFARLRDEGDEGADVLLLTDGQIWQADEMAAAARAGGHRVFAIGVGTAPAEGVLRALAEATGGACEFATPGEALEAAARRMLQRMRQPRLERARIDWGDEPLWSSGPVRGLFGGDTVVALAGFAPGARGGPLRLLADDAQGRAVELARSEADAPCEGDALARIGAARRLRDGAADLAVRYQLMSADTRCVLVHVRAEHDKTTEPAALHRVSSMLAAGWGGMGSVRGAAVSCAPLHAPAVALCTQLEEPFAVSDAKFCAFYELPDFFGKAEADDATDRGREATPATLDHLARLVGERLARGEPADGLQSVPMGAPTGSDENPALHADVQHALDHAVSLGASPAQAWLLLAHWVLARAQGPVDGALDALLRPWVDAIDPSLAERVCEGFALWLGGHPLDHWPLSRVQRPGRAMGRMGA